MNASKTKTSIILALGLALVAVPGVSAGDTAGKHAGKDKFKAMDADSDGKVTRAEYAAAAKKKFAAIDTNQDGSIAVAELAAANAKMAAEETARTGTAATPGATDKAAKADKVAKAGLSSEEWLKRYDTNNDGQVSASEHAAASDATFAKLDANSDGSLSAEELNAGSVEKKY